MLMLTVTVYETLTLQREIRVMLWLMFADGSKPMLPKLGHRHSTGKSSKLSCGLLRVECSGPSILGRGANRPVFTYSLMRIGSARSKEG